MFSRFKLAMLLAVLLIGSAVSNAEADVYRWQFHLTAYDRAGTEVASRSLVTDTRTIGEANVHASNTLAVWGQQLKKQGIDWKRLSTQLLRRDKISD